MFIFLKDLQMMFRAHHKALMLLCKGVIDAARSGQILPILTIVFILQLLLQLILNQLLLLLLFEPSLDLTRGQGQEGQGQEGQASLKSINLLYAEKSPTSILILLLFHQYNKLLIILNVSVFLTPGYTLLLALYRHSIQRIFNRKIPSTILECIPSFVLHLQLLRPIEIIFRFMTVRFRVLPDIIVLGEVRCGTTSFCQQLVSLLQEEVQHDIIIDEDRSCTTDGDGGDDYDYDSDDECRYFFNCHTPFCPWMHPELDHKETFYFVGHYLGIVTPEHYRMCFPLQITKLCHEMYHLFKYYLSLLSLGTRRSSSKRRRRRIKKPLFITFDGCAQYLTSPTSPYLIAAAYKLANQKPPILISCIRDPIQQTISWWRYENNAQQWGESIGLKEWNSDLRSMAYPPKCIAEALDFTQSDYVKGLYRKAEEFFSLDFLLDRRNSKRREKSLYLPYELMSWPGGQLTGIGRNGMFLDNILRYERVFSQAFHEGGALKDDDDEKATLEIKERKFEYGSLQSDDSNFQKSLKYVNILPLEYLSQGNKMKKFVANILNQVAQRKDSKHEILEYGKGVRYFELYQFKNLSNVHRNATSGISSSSVEDNDDTINLLKEFFLSSSAKE